MLELIKEAGLTDGEAKTYLALLELGSCTTGPLIEKSKIARSFIYTILENLIEKGLVSYIIKEKTKHYQAAEPEKILNYIEKRKHNIEESRDKIKRSLPQLKLLQKFAPKTEVRVYEGFNGIKTAFEHHELKLKKGDDSLCLGAYPIQKEKYHLYWMQYHRRREKKGIKARMLMNKGTARKVLENRNSYKGCDARRMPTDITTPAWFFIYKDTVSIMLQDTPELKTKKAMAVEIINQEIADTFRAYFEDYWKRTKPFK